MIANSILRCEKINYLPIIPTLPWHPMKLTYSIWNYRFKYDFTICGELQDVDASYLAGSTTDTPTRNLAISNLRESVIVSRPNLDVW